MILLKFAGISHLLRQISATESWQKKLRNESQTSVYDEIRTWDNDG